MVKETGKLETLTAGMISGRLHVCPRQSLCLILAFDLARNRCVAAANRQPYLFGYSVIRLASYRV